MHAPKQAAGKSFKVPGKGNTLVPSAFECPICVVRMTMLLLLTGA